MTDRSCSFEHSLGKYHVWHVFCESVIPKVSLSLHKGVDLGLCFCKPLYAVSMWTHVILHFSLSLGCRKMMLFWGFVMWLGKPDHSKLKIKGKIYSKEWENDVGGIQKAVILTIQSLRDWESSLSQTHTLRAVWCPCELAQCVGNEGSPLLWHQLICTYSFWNSKPLFYIHQLTPPPTWFFDSSFLILFAKLPSTPSSF